MSGNEPLIMEDVGGIAGPEIFALTDEQILGMEPEGQEVEGSSSGREQVNGSKGPSTAAATVEASAQDDRKEQREAVLPADAPRWLAERMKDPWVGDEARELWEGVQRAQREAAAYREAFVTPEDARALKEIYPGGVAEAKSAAVRSRELAEIDGVFFGAAGRPAEELRAGRAALVEKLYAQDPGAFREMVEAGVRILGRVPSGQRRVASGEGSALAQDGTSVPGSLQSESQTARLFDRDDSADGGARSVAGKTLTPEGASYRDGASGGDGKSARPGIIPQTSRDGAAVTVPQEVASRYREFERATNAELEKSVGGTIARAMEAALPNLRHAYRSGGEGPHDSRGKQASSLQERLATAVREDVETALRSDASLGEQVARVLSGRRLDEAAQAQVVRLIDTRAQQLVPGAVRRVVGSWTQATLSVRKAEPGPESARRGEEERRVERASSSERRTGRDERSRGGNERSTVGAGGRGVPRGRVDYRKLSDEQILGM